MTTSNISNLVLRNEIICFHGCMTIDADNAVNMNLKGYTVEIKLATIQKLSSDDGPRTAIIRREIKQYHPIDGKESSLDVLEGNWYEIPQYIYNAVFGNSGMALLD